jgi:hypothetical protein
MELKDVGLFVILLDDELVKSHIPYVVHASTKPVLSERSKGDADFLRDHH